MAPTFTGHLRAPLPVAVTVSVAHPSHIDFHGLRTLALEDNGVYVEHDNTHCHFLHYTSAPHKDIRAHIWDCYILDHKANNFKHAIKIKSCTDIPGWIRYMAHDGIEKLIYNTKDWNKSEITSFVDNNELLIESTIEHTKAKRLDIKDYPYIVINISKILKLHPVKDFTEIRNYLTCKGYPVHEYGPKRTKTIIDTVRILHSSLSRAAGTEA